MPSGQNAGSIRCSCMPAACACITWLPTHCSCCSLAVCLPASLKVFEATSFSLISLVAYYCRTEHCILISWCAAVEMGMSASAMQEILEVEQVEEPLQLKRLILSQCLV